MIFFDPVMITLPPALSQHRPLSEKQLLDEGSFTEKWQKERYNARKHQNSAEKIFQTSFLMECYRHSIKIHINSTEHICLYASKRQITFFAGLYIEFLCPFLKKTLPTVS